jgi:hypothetical protein
MSNNCLKKGPVISWIVRKTQNRIGNGSLKPEPAGISKIKYPLIATNK